MKFSNSLRSTLSIVLFGLVFSQGASAASITLSSVTPSTTGAITPDFGSNPYTVTQVRPTFAKLSGTGVYTASGADSSVILVISGFISDVESGDEVGIDYDFTFGLTGAGSVLWSIDSEINIGIALPGPTDSGGPVTASDSGVFIGSETAIAPFAIASATFTATITANWTGATAGDKLTFTIPNNSIDFRTEPVPEPSSALLLAVGGLLCLSRKRR